MARDGIRKLQLEAASCTDELLDISNEISDHVLPLYTGTDRSMFDLQCRMQIARCKLLTQKLEQIRDALTQALDGCTGADEVSAERRDSARLTLQIIAQNLTILGQKQVLLRELLIGSEEAGSRQKAAEALSDTAQAAALKAALRKELDRCRNADENSN